MFQETLQHAFTTIVTHANLVKRVVFPLETLPVAQALSSLGNQMFGTLALVVKLIIGHEFHATMLWFPALVIPQLLATLGAAWLIASLGVFLRDIAQGITLILMAWMYLTPIIYPESMRAGTLSSLYQCQSVYRAHTQLSAHLPRRCRSRLVQCGLLYSFAVVLFVFGYWWFAKTRRNFADVI